MVHIPTNPNETEWSYCTAFTGRVAKPGSKNLLHGNGRVSLNFSIIVPTGMPWDCKTASSNYQTISVRCREFDPEFLLYTHDVVRVSGVLTKVDQNLGLLVNKLEVLARYYPKSKVPA